MTELKSENIEMNGVGPKVVSFSFGGTGQDDTMVLADHYYSDEAGYGWLEQVSRKNVIRTAYHSEIFKSYITGKTQSTFKVRLPKGRYRIALYCGDGKGIHYFSDVRVTTDQTQHDLGGIPTHRGYFNLTQMDVDVGPEEPGLCISFSSDPLVADGNGWTANYLEIFLRNGGTAERKSRVFLPELNNWTSIAVQDSTVRDLISDWRRELPAFGDIVPEPEPTGYLDVIEGIVDFFSDHQDAVGAIVDPYKQVEFQYSTPCYAYAATLIATERNRDRLLDNGVRAYEFAARALAERTAADGHEDFYPSPLAHTYRMLKPRIDPGDLARMSAPLSRFDPYKTYRKLPGGTKRSGANWNCKALAGHYLLHQVGLQENGHYAGDSLQRQGWLFNNEFGLYAEGPLTYDAFPRAWLADMLDWGYDGPASADLERALTSAALTSLFLQAPTGELPPGGRSSQHIWSDAVQCVTFEWAAKRFAGQDDDLAGVFKRAARRVLDSMRLWLRDSGEFQVVKNRVDPAARHGFEPYTSHSQYNLLCAAALGFAYEIAKSAPPLKERWTPAEKGASGFFVGSGIDKAFATANGMQVEVATEPTPNQTPRGIIQVRFAGLPGQIPMGDGLPDKPNFFLPAADMPPQAAALGLAWQDQAGPEGDGRGTTSLAGLSAKRVITDVLKSLRTVDGWFTRIDYTLAGKLGPRVISESIEISRDAVNITWNWKTWNSPVFARLPLFASDGEQEAETDLNGDCIHLTFEGKTVQFRIDGSSGGWTIKDGLRPFRQGYFRMAEAIAAGQSLTLQIRNTE